MHIHACMNNANRYQLNLFESKLSYESVILQAPSVECLEFNGPASLYRHAIELKKKARKCSDVLRPPAKKKTIEKKTLSQG